MPRMIRLEHINLPTSDPARMAAFYHDFLGMTNVFARFPADQGAFVAGPERHDGPDLSFMRAGANPAEHTPSSRHIAVQVGTLADLRACPEEVARLGGTFLFAIVHGPSISCHILDPDGNQIELMWRTGRMTERPVAQVVDITLPEDELLRMVDAVVAQK